MTLNHLMARFQPRRFGEYTPSLPLLPGPLSAGVVAPDRVLSMGQMEQTVYKQKTDVKLWLLYNTWNHLTECKKEPRLISECYLQNVLTNYIYI